MELIGWTGSVLLALCALPQAIKSVRTGSAEDLSWLFLLMWGVGDICLLVYTWPLDKLALTLNYSLNIVLIAVIVSVKVRRQNELKTKNQ